jgi:DNA-binding Xre family transcriptional regulator
MAVQDDEVREKLEHVFARQDFYQACMRRDAGAMVAILGDHGVTQAQIVARTGIAQSTLSLYKSGKHEAKFASTFEKLADGLGMPLSHRQALGLTGKPTTGPAR